MGSVVKKRKKKIRKHKYRKMLKKTGWRGMRGRAREADPLVKVAGAYTQAEVETCLDALRNQEIRTEVRDGGERGFEVWVPLSQESRARLVLGLSGRSVIRLPRMHRATGEER
ncbi:MAG: AURKAIP1/COX24 domain-containing protein [Chloroflexi bacterium]|nr:AURKAIP1/COX24 domain-containing protein [Chloroflexota bacterium]